jgi:hypothetical protein
VIKPTMDKRDQAFYDKMQWWMNMALYNTNVECTWTT